MRFEGEIWDQGTSIGPLKHNMRFCGFVNVSTEELRIPFEEGLKVFLGYIGGIYELLKLFD